MSWISCIKLSERLGLKLIDLYFLKKYIKQVALFFHGFEFVLSHDLRSFYINIILLNYLFLKLSDIDDVRKMVKRLFGSIFAFLVLS